MAEKAAELYGQGYAPYILPSGRYSITMGKFAGVQSKKEIYDGDYETEWEFLKTVLMKNKVPEEAILREDQATFTYENAIYSRQVTDMLGIEVKQLYYAAKLTMQEDPLCITGFYIQLHGYWYAQLARMELQEKTGEKRRQEWRLSQGKLTGS